MKINIIEYPSKKVWFPHLDKLRALVAIFVVIAHMKYWVDFENQYVINLFKLLTFSGNGAHLGVVFFFILSGFLITYLLFQEKNDNSDINIRHFYIRGTLRI